MTLQQTDRLAALDADGRSLLLHAARTANTFAPTPVEDAELEAIWELARWPPTAANTQPLRVLYVRTEQGRARLVANMADGNKAETATAPAVLAFDSRFHEHVPAMFPIRPEPADALAADEPMRKQLSRDYLEHDAAAHRHDRKRWSRHVQDTLKLPKAPG